MSVTYPLFAFERDDRSMYLIDRPDRILYVLEALDIENDEYVFWDATGAGVSIRIVKDKVASIEACVPSFSLREALHSYGAALGVAPNVTEGSPIEVWRRIETEVSNRPKKRGFFSRFFSN